MSRETIKTIADRVLVEPLPLVTKTASGLIIPSLSNDKHRKGVVKSIGNEVNQVRVGDTILYGEYSGTELKLDGTTYLMMYEKDIVAVTNS